MVRDLDHDDLELALLWVDHVRATSRSAGLDAELEAAEAAVRSEPARFPEAVRVAVRDVLRKGGYKPTGRGKPASEYLLGQARGAGLPRISGPVDVCNVVSLVHGFPISVLDAELLGAEPRLRFGRAGESYVFNASGQSMDLAGLPVLCRGDEPVGNAVKDAMVCKVNAASSRLVYVVYGSRALRAELLEACLADLVRLAQTELGASALRAERL
jgi:DNA/RNA-binding domain of Phe-tRNA-synthetase-like protein